MLVPNPLTQDQLSKQQDEEKLRSCSNHEEEFYHSLKVPADVVFPTKVFDIEELALLDSLHVC